VFPRCDRSCRNHGNRSLMSISCTKKKSVGRETVRADSKSTQLSATPQLLQLQRSPPQLNAHQASASQRQRQKQQQSSRLFTTLSCALTTSPSLLPPFGRRPRSRSLRSANKKRCRVLGLLRDCDVYPVEVASSKTIESHRELCGEEGSRGIVACPTART